jgi:hypothetical protein
MTKFYDAETLFQRLSPRNIDDRSRQAALSGHFVMPCAILAKPAISTATPWRLIVL